MLALNNAAWLLAMQRRDLDEAEALIERAIDVSGELAHLRDTRGCVHMAMGQLRHALVDFEASVAESPQPTSLLHLAAALARNGEVQQARDALKRAREAGLRSTHVHPLDRALLEDVERILAGQDAA